jgi:N utilization substance protein A
MSTGLLSMTELSRVIESVGKDRGIRKEIIISAVEQAVLMAAQKKYGPHAVLEAHYNPENGEVDVFLFKKVVESEPEMLEESEEIDIEEARKLDPGAQLEDELGVKVESPDFGRIDSQTAKQVIFQKIRDAEREIVFNEYIHRKGEIITGIARRVERGNLVIDLGKTDALLPRNGIIPGEVFKPGDRVQAYLEDVAVSTRGPQLYLSRTSPKYLIKLFEQEVPEIRDGIIEIKHCVREPGAQAKIAVVSKDRDIDPIGACIGMKGTRVQTIIQELKGEKIDIVQWSDNPVIYVRGALGRVEISSVRMDERNRIMEIMVEDDKLAQAIGKRGQNVRLAALLTNWKLDIISRSKLQRRASDATYSLQIIEGVNDTMAQAIYQAGFLSPQQVAEADLEDVQKIPGYIEAEQATKLKERAAIAADHIAKNQSILANAPEALAAAAAANNKDNNTQPKDSKSLAEERLREMMKQAQQ